ncbi:PREDICTED: palmitoyltransferase AKR1-like [Wasmannia auropunctata]|uniref:palmitoyltransferase AKR1-like n=1 Tax=Wasmannia auropunctata TaxID=64793 RepID=UPI0005EF395E|nr:PREDICTED: palmitoyltransferase AKR1-like [Wasmannia auropunctata]
MYKTNIWIPGMPKLENLYKNSACINNEDFESFRNIVQRALAQPPFIPDESFNDITHFVMIEFNNLNQICLNIAKHGLTIFVKSLLRDGVNPNRVNKFFKSAPIHFATKGGHFDTLKALLAEPMVNPNLQAGRKTALHIAVNRNDRRCALVLLQKGANANISQRRPACSLSSGSEGRVRHGRTNTTKTRAKLR